MRRIQSGASASDIVTELESLIGERFPLHPFEVGITKENFEQVMAEYLAMSIAFPYIQAGSAHENYRKAIQISGDTNHNLEITAAIGTLLVSDEFGADELIRQSNKEQIPLASHVEQCIHSNLLRHDIATILGKPLKPRWSSATRSYLDQLFFAFSDQTKNRNVAYMITFEMHAYKMILAIWSAINRCFGMHKYSELQYFSRHIGGDSPAEALHIEMTLKMIDALISDEDREGFILTCTEGFTTNIRWCESILSNH